MSSHPHCIIVFLILLFSQCVGWSTKNVARFKATTAVSFSMDEKENFLLSMQNGFYYYNRKNNTLTQPLLTLFDDVANKFTSLQAAIAQSASIPYRYDPIGDCIYTGHGTSIYRLSKYGVVSLVCGTGSGFVDGDCTTVAKIQSIISMDIDPAKRLLYLLSTNNARIVNLTNQTLTTVVTTPGYTNLRFCNGRLYLAGGNKLAYLNGASMNVIFASGVAQNIMHYINNELYYVGTSEIKKFAQSGIVPYSPNLVSTTCVVPVQNQTTCFSDDLAILVRRPNRRN